MKLNLNDSELTEILVLIENALKEDQLYDMEKATLRNFMDKVNNNIQYQHHDAVDDLVCTITADYYDLEGK